MYPVFIVTGQAGSGKDTLAAFMAEGGGICIAQADPLKRFAQQVFHFNTHQLWGPSEARNAPDSRSAMAFVSCWSLNRNQAQKWLQDISGPGGKTDSLTDKLDNWFYQNVAGREVITPRHILQTLGTEFGRSYDPSIWIRYAQKMARELLEEGGTYDRERGHIIGVERPRFVVITDGRFANEVLAVKFMGGKAIRLESGEGKPGLKGAAGQHSSETEQASIPPEWFDALVVNLKSDGYIALQKIATSLVHDFLPPPRNYVTRYYR